MNFVANQNMPFSRNFVVPKLLRSCVIGLAVTLVGTPIQAQSPETYFGTVRASDIFSMSYGARGCIVEVSELAKSERVVQAGQVLVKLDDQRLIASAANIRGQGYLN